MLLRLFVAVLLCGFAVTTDAQSCEPSETTLCFYSNRFAVSVDWRDSDSNLLSATRTDSAGQGMGSVLIPDAADGNEVGLFAFEDPSQPDILVRMPDGTPINGFIWVFATSTSAREFTLTLEDTSTGEVRQYANPLGQRPIPIMDTQAFANGSARQLRKQATIQQSASKPAVLERGQSSHWRKGNQCVADATTTCLMDNRFALSVDWRDFEDNTGTGMGTVVEGDHSATFAFFNPDFPDLLINLVDGSSINGQIWLRVGALNNVEYTLTVTDFADGSQRTLFNPLGLSPVSTIDVGILGNTINLGHSGFWFNPDTSGQGASLELAPGLDNFAFLAIYSFEQAAGRKVGSTDQRWITGQGNYDGNRVNLVLSSTSGGAFNDPQAVETVETGNAEFEVTDCNTAVLRFELTDPPLSGEMPLQRLLPIDDGTMDLCEHLSLLGPLGID